MSGEIRDRAIPLTRELDPQVRRGRLLAAKARAPHSAPRFAILLGHWDGGDIVGGAAARTKERP